MSQRNPMNERYTLEKNTGNTRKSAASAKPKSKAAASVTYSSPKKSTKERKEEIRKQRKEDEARQREIDKKYYKPDTERYKKLRIYWVIGLVVAVACTAASWFLREIEPQWISFALMILAYGGIIFAFYIDFSKIRKERRAYQTRMLALEVEQQKKEKKEARKAGANKKANEKADDKAEDKADDKAEEDK